MGGQILISGFFLTLIICLAFRLEIGGPGWMANFNALLIVLGGTFFVSLIIYPWRKMVWMFTSVRQAAATGDRVQQTIQSIVSLARDYRKEWSLRSLERQARSLPSGLLKKGIDMILLRYGRDEIKEALQREGLILGGQIEESQKILRAMAQMAPSLGLITTVVNVIRIFSFSGEIGQILPYTAVALLSIFYGLSLGNLCCLPLASKLKDFKEEETSRMEIIIQGVLNLYDQEHPRTVQSRLEAYALRGKEWVEIPAEPELSLLTAQEIAIESKPAGSILVN